MRLSLSLAALGLLTSAASANTAAASVGKKQSLRRAAAAAKAHNRHLIETEGEFTEDQELRQDDLDDEEFEPEAPLNPTNATDAEPMNPIEPDPETLPEPEEEEAEPMNPIEPVPETLPEDEPMPENPIELPDNCKDCLGKDSAGAFAFVAEDATGTGSCVVSCANIRLMEGFTCYSGAENDDKVCKDLEKVAEEAAKLAEEAAAAAEEEEAAAAEEETAAPPLPSDLTTCEACLGPDAQGQFYAWFPKLGDAGTCLSGCGVNKDSPCFTGAVYSDENCGEIAEAMAKLDEATAAPTDAAEEEGDMMPTAAPTDADEETTSTGTPTMVEVEATMAPTKEGTTGTPTMASMTTTGAPTMIIPPEEGVMEPTSEPSMPAADVPTFVTPEPTMGADGGVDVEDSIECPEGYTVDTFFAQEGGDLCTVCIGPPVTTLPEVEGNSTEPAEPIVEDCTSLCDNDACEFTPAGCGRVICPGDLTADPTAMPTVMTTMAPTTATPTMMPTVKATTVSPTMMTEPTAAPTTMMMEPTDAPSMPLDTTSGATGRAVATGIVGAVATAAAYLLMA